jgi:hypothetical protein
MKSSKQKSLKLDNVEYPIIDTAEIAPGSVAVDILIDDLEHVFPAAMLAGLVATRVEDSRDKKLSETGERDVVSAVPGWWMYAKREGETRSQENDRKFRAAERALCERNT